MKRNAAQASEPELHKTVLCRVMTEASRGTEVNIIYNCYNNNQVYFVLQAAISLFASRHDQSWTGQFTDPGLVILPDQDRSHQLIQ
jgi:hypothetical protein